MTHKDQRNQKQREDWIAFHRELHVNYDARAAGLMEEFRHVAHRLRQLSDANLESSGLSTAQFRVLMSLQFCEWSGDCSGLNPSEISEQQGTSRNTISALIRSLEEANMIERRLDTVDRRRFNIVLTDAGRKVVTDHAAQHVQLINELFAVLGEDEIKTLGNILQTLNQKAEAMRESHLNLSRR